MTIRSWTDEEVTGEANVIGNARVRAFAREILRLRAEAPRWVPVAERLPEDNTEVLVCTDETAWGQGMERSVDVYANGDWMLGDEHGPVVRWMPLPALPER